MKKYFITAAIALGIVYALMNYTMYVYNNYPPPPAGYPASRKVSAAMDFHGIGFAKCDQNGKLTFKRDGERCKLFTNAFEKKWRNTK